MHDEASWSWFSLLFPDFYHRVEHAAAALSWPVSDDGKTWVTHSPIGVEHLFAATLGVAIVLLFGILAARRIKNVHGALVPESKLTAGTFIELTVEAVYGMMRDQMGPKAAKFFLPLIGTCAIFIFFSNALGLVPGFVPATDNLNITLTCGLIIFVTTHIFGVKEHGLGYFKHFLGPVIWLAPLMVVIELISHLVRPASLGVRLMANMTADHAVLTIFHGLAPWLIPVPMYLLGSIVVVVQTLVFCLLSTVYISMAIAHEEH